MTGATPMPNRLLDVWMPRLRDTEWRVLCVVVRQTLGWQAPGGTGRKASDWLTQSQLKRRTGRNSEAVSRAVQRLVSLGLLCVRDAGGDALTSPEARRRHRGRLYYSLDEGACSMGEVRKANSTKETDTKEKSSGEGSGVVRLYTGWSRASSVTGSRKR
jgi:hypothetical protein